MAFEAVVAATFAVEPIFKIADWIFTFDEAFGSVFGIALGVDELGDVTWTESFSWTSILYPGGRNVLKPSIKSVCPLNNVETLDITPGVSILKSNQS